MWDRILYTYTPDGMLEKAAEAGTVYHYTHDQNGRMLTKRAWGKTLISCEYNRSGRIKTLETIGGTTTYEYDLAGRIKTVTSKEGLLAEYQYARNGIQSEVRYGNGLVTSYGYDNRNQLSMLTSGFTDKAPLLQASYQYDGNGNRIRKEETFGLPAPKMENLHLLQPQTGLQNLLSPNFCTADQKLQSHTEVTCYQYDSLNQLTTENKNGRNTSYQYEQAGNRVRKEVNGVEERYNYNSRNQLIEKASQTENVKYSYDLAGNLTEEQRYQLGKEHNAEKISYQYGVFNRNTIVQGTDFLQINRYDAEGYRYETEENGIVSRFAYHYGMLLSEYDKDNEATNNYTLGNEYVGGELSAKGSNIPSNITIPKEKEMCYYICDEQGSIRYVLNQDGEVENYYQYSAFGESEVEEENYYNRLHYNSQIYDSLTEQYYLRARYYQPQIGRFTQEDILYADGLNPYAYCKNNPVIYCDPSGFQQESQAFNLCEEAKSRERILRVVIPLDMIEQAISRMEEVIICLEEIGVQEGQPI